MRAALLVAVVALVAAAAALPAHKYSTRVVRTKYGPLRGLVLSTQPSPVEAFLGVPYASPPVGALRYMPPLTPSPWRHTRLADAYSAVCPQRAPDISNRSDALLRFPRGRLRQLEQLLPLLANQSEDCLYLNLYVPRPGEYSIQQDTFLYLLIFRYIIFKYNYYIKLRTTIIWSHVNFF